MPRAGYRARKPGGRPHHVIPTQAIRVPEPITMKAKNPTYERLGALIADWKIRNTETSNPNSQN